MPDLDAAVRCYGLMLPGCCMLSSRSRRDLSLCDVMGFTLGILVVTYLREEGLRGVL